LTSKISGFVLHQICVVLHQAKGSCPSIHTK
jgi:hypothetical protein